MDYFDSNGLINSRPDEVHSENAPLWSMEYALLCRLFGIPCQFIEASLFAFYKKCMIRPGLFNQRTFLDGTPEDHVSHDQLTALMCFSYVRGLVWHKEIWQEIKRQGYRYDNLNPDKPRRWLHPRDIIFYGILNDVTWCKWLFPVFSLICQQTCIKKWKVRNGIKMPATGGKLLTFVRCVSTMHRLPKMQKLIEKCTTLIKKNDTMKCWTNVFRIYFPEEKHPITQIIEQGRSYDENKDSFFYQ